MDSETELDIAGDPMVEVDASCLMSRLSVDTPSRRGRKNTTVTEVAGEDLEENVMKGEPAILLFSASKHLYPSLPIELN